MSNTGSSGLPPSIGSGDKGFPPSKAELKAKIIAIRGEARVQKVRETLEGQLIRNNNDGTSRIQTPRGEIDVKLPLREPIPEGTRLNIEIPRGNPPRQVTVRPAPNNPQTQAQTSPPSPQITESRNAATKSSIPPETRAAIDETVRQNQATQNIQTTAPRNLNQGDIVRLQPLPVTPEALIENLATQNRTAENLANTARVQNIAETLRLQPQILPSNNLVANATQTTKTAQNPILQNSVSGSLNQNTFTIQPPAIQNTQISASPAPPILKNTTMAVPASAASRPDALSIRFTPQPSTPLISPQFQVNTLQTSTSQMTSQIASQSPNDDLRIAQITPSNLAIIDAKADFDISFQTNIARESGNPVNILQAKAHQSVMKVVGFVNTPSTALPQTGSPPSQANMAVLAVPSFNAATGAIETSFMTLPWQITNLTIGQTIQATPINVNALSNSQITNNPAAQASVITPFIPSQFFGQYSWPAMDDVMQSLQQTLPQAAAQTLAQSVPSPASSPARLPPAALLFVAAVRGGDISGWLGDKNADLLKRIGKSDALQRINSDLSGMQRTSSEPIGGQDWRAMALPYMGDQGLSKMMLYYRYDEQENAQDKERKGTRFVFDLELSHIGPVQIDGLHRPMDSKNARLDLIVRTEKQLGEAMQKYMRRLYIDALESNDLAGDLSFQGTPERFVKIDWPNDAQIY